jgi:hypothetical protein
MNAATHADAVIVRPAEIGDAGRIGELITELGYQTDGETMIERLAPILSDPHYLTLVASLNGPIVGVAGATRRGPLHPVGLPVDVDTTT